MMNEDWTVSSANAWDDTENQIAAKNIKQQSSGNGRHQQHKLWDKTEKVELAGART